MTALSLIAAAYLIGSLSFAVIVSRVMGLPDPRTFGSGNPGATNVLRTGRKAAAVLTLLGDALKGWVVVALAGVLVPRLGLPDGVVLLCALAVFLGHLFPVFFRFQGGKGVATALGVLLASAPWLGVATLATWVIIAVFFRYSSLAALIAALFAPAYYWLGEGLAWSASGAKLLAIAVMSLLLIWRHRQNIQRLLAGTESKLGSKKS